MEKPYTEQPSESAQSSPERRLVYRRSRARSSRRTVRETRRGGIEKRGDKRAPGQSPMHRRARIRPNDGGVRLNLPLIGSQVASAFYGYKLLGNRTPRPRPPPTSCSCIGRGILLLPAHSLCLFLSLFLPKADRSMPRLRSLPSPLASRWIAGEAFD